MAIQHRGANTMTKAGGSGTTLTGTVPASAQVGDLLVANPSQNSTAPTITGPTGWVAFPVGGQGASGTSAGTITTLWWKICESGDIGASAVWTSSVTTAMHGAIDAFYDDGGLTWGVEPSDAWANTAVTVDGTTITTNSLTTKHDNELIVATVAVGEASVGDATFTAPGTMTEVADIGVAGAAGACTLAYLVQATAGTVTGQAFTCSVTFDSAVSIIAGFRLLPANTVQYVVAAGADDGYQEGSGTNPINGATTVKFGFDNTVFLRFTGVAVPQGATISAASIDFKDTGSGLSGSCLGLIKASDVDDATMPTTTANVNALVYTSATQAWTLPARVTNATVVTPDFASVVQEITDRAGWVSGNDLLVAIADNGSDDFDMRQYATVEHTTLVAPRLTITYTEVSHLTRDVPLSAALSSTLTRDVPLTAAISQAGNTRTVPTSAALSSTLTRTVPTSAALSTLGLTRTVPLSAAVSSTLTRDVPTSAALSSTLTRDVPATAALSLTGNTRTVPVTAALSLTGNTRTVPTSAALSSTLTRTVPTSAALSSTLTRTVPATAALSQAGLTRDVPLTAALQLGSDAPAHRLDAAVPTVRNMTATPTIRDTTPNPTIRNTTVEWS